MTPEEALKVLVKMRAWRRWGKGEQNEKDKPEMPEQKEVDEALDVYIEVLSRFSLPSNINEAAEEFYPDFSDSIASKAAVDSMRDAFKAGARWRDAQIPKLPSNLDEAAIDAAQLDMQDRQIMEATNDERLRYSRIFRRGFKAGAEWMERQGETVEGYIAGTNEVAAILAIPRKEYNKGDKVVVQIRKK